MEESFRFDEEIYENAITTNDNLELFTFSYINVFIKVTNELRISPEQLLKRFFLPIHFFCSFKNSVFSITSECFAIF